MDLGLSPSEKVEMESHTVVCYYRLQYCPQFKIETCIWQFLLRNFPGEWNWGSCIRRRVASEGEGKDMGRVGGWVGEMGKGARPETSYGGLRKICID